MTALNDLKTAYIECAKCWGLHASKLPFGTQRDKAGGNHFEFSPDGENALVSRDWGGIPSDLKHTKSKKCFMNCLREMPKPRACKSLLRNNLRQDGMSKKLMIVVSVSLWL